MKYRFTLAWPSTEALLQAAMMAAAILFVAFIASSPNVLPGLMG